jgi:pyruvate-formate lyase-activating enzyme
MEEWKNTYCSKSWTDVNVDFSSEFVRNCCKSQPIKFVPNLDKTFFEFSPDLVKRKTDSLNGIQNEQCNFCWKEEGNRATYRDVHNRWSTEFVESTRDDLLSTDKSFANYIEVKFSNTCDMACLYCSPKFSSKIAIEENVRIKSVPLASEFEAFKEFSDPLIKNAVKLVKEDIKKDVWDTTQLRFVFLGGEPTLIDQFYDFINHITERVKHYTQEKNWEYKMRNIRLEIVTNGNTTPALMEKFFKLVGTTSFQWTVGISNESFGHDAELIRNGLNWERFQHNFNQYISRSKKIDSINLAPALNIFSLKTFHLYVAWVHEQFNKQLELTGYCPAFTWHGNFIADPVMDINVLPIEYRKYVDLAIDLIEKETNPKFKNKQNTIKFLNQMKDRIGSIDPESPDVKWYKERARDWLLVKEKKKGVSNLTPLLLNIGYDNYKEYI